MLSASVGDLIGAALVDIHDTVIGKIEDLVLDLRTGCIAYAVVALERSRLDARRPTVVLPWKVLILDRDKNTFTLDVDTDVLQETDLFAYYTYPRCAPC